MYGDIKAVVEQVGEDGFTVEEWDGDGGLIGECDAAMIDECVCNIEAGYGGTTTGE